MRRRRVVLQRGDRLDKVAVELLGVPPGELERGTRGDDLAHVAEALRERRVLATGGLPVGPGAREAVVGDAAEEHHVGVVGAVTASPISSLK